MPLSLYLAALTDAAGDFVESEALVSLDGDFLIVMLPRSEDK